MEAWFLRQWYEREQPCRLLLPLAWLYGWVTAARGFAYSRGWLRKQRLPVPVVVVGNLNAGGTGKTPLTLALAEAFTKRGWRPAILSRGYGTPFPDPREVRLDGEAWLYGDEPLLLARRSRVPVWIGRDRVETGRELLTCHPEVNLLLCDDGLQHLALERDVELVVVDGERGFGNRRLLPAGPLREPVERLDTVDAVVVNGGAGAVSGVEAPTFAMDLAASAWTNLADPDRSLPLEAFRGQTCHVVAGIGNPERFFSRLEAWGISVIRHPFPDHHEFSPADFRWASPRMVLMTEKDGIKCREFADASFWMLPVTATLDPALPDLILDLIARRRHGSAIA